MYGSNAGRVPEVRVRCSSTIPENFRAFAVDILSSVLQWVVLQSCRIAGTRSCYPAGHAAEITAAIVQMASLRTGGDHLCGRLVPAILALLSQRRRTSHRTRPSRRPQHYLALGAALRTGTE